MIQNADLHEYVSYIGSHPDAKANMEVVCSAWSGEGPSLAVNWTPVGKVYVYNDYLVFLTTSKAKPGHFNHALSQFWDEFSPYLAASRWANRPETLVWDIVKTLGSGRKDEDKEFVAKALTSPNSFVIKLSNVTRVEKIHDWKGNSIIIYDSNEKYTLQQNMNAEAPDALRYLVGSVTGKRSLQKFRPWAPIRSSWSYISGQWNDQLFEFMCNIAKRNSQM